MNEDGRGPWYLVFGLVIGLAMGLLVAWVVSPVRYVENSPDSLSRDFKDQYRSMIALAFTADGDIGRARARLNLLEDENPAQALASQAQRLLANQGEGSAEGGQVRAMAVLAAALNEPATVRPSPTAGGTATAQVQTSPPVATYTALPSPAQPATATLAPVPTATIEITATGLPDLPTATTTPTQMAPLKPASVEAVCSASLPEGLLQVEVTDREGKPIPAVRLTVTWANGENVFYTGLKPAIDVGYADFAMQAGVVYTLKAGEGGEPALDLQAQTCTSEDGKARLGGVKVIFSQP